MTQRMSSGSPSGGQESMMQTVREQTSEAGRDAMKAGGRVAQTAAGQGRQVAAETGRQTRGVFDQAYARMREEADAQQRRAVERLHSLGNELQSMCGQGERQDMAGTLARQAAGVAHQMADWLQRREPGEVVHDLREYARHNPGTFLAGAAIAGMVAGRVSKNLSSAGGDGRGGGAQPAGQAPMVRTGMAMPPAQTVEAMGPLGPETPGGEPVREPAWAPRSHAEAR